MNFTDFGAPVGLGIPGRENDRSGSERVVNLSNSVKVRVVREDPYGFWYIKWHSGATPLPISGSYTSADLAIRALDAYLDVETFRTQRVDEPVAKVPPLQYKKPKDGKTASV